MGRGLCWQWGHRLRYPRPVMCRARSRDWGQRCPPCHGVGVLCATGWVSPTPPTPGRSLQSSRCQPPPPLPSAIPVPSPGRWLHRNCFIFLVPQAGAGGEAPRPTSPCWQAPAGGWRAEPCRGGRAGGGESITRSCLFSALPPALPRGGRWRRSGRAPRVPEAGVQGESRVPGSSLP